MKEISAKSVTVKKWKNGSINVLDDIVAEEIKIEMYLNGEHYAALMCSPWDLEELALGYMYLAGAFGSMDEVTKVECSGRNVYVNVNRNSEGNSPGISENPVCLTPEDVVYLIGTLEKSSETFKHTGGVHNAALSDGKVIITNTEDVSRHNALNRLIGRCLLRKIKFENKVLIFSGRVPEEIISNAAAARLGAIISVSAPTSRAIEIAEENGILLICFARGNSFNVYTCSDRLIQ